MRGGYFNEKRDNGKVTTFAPTQPEGNDTTWNTMNGGVRMVLPDQSALEGSFFVDDVEFNSNFIAVPNLVTRAIGRLTLVQFVPTKQIDPIRLEKSYYLEPDSSSPKAYALLAATLEQSDRIALVHFTLRQRTSWSST